MARPSTSNDRASASAAARHSPASCPSLAASYAPPRMTYWSTGLSDALFASSSSALANDLRAAGVRSASCLANSSRMSLRDCACSGLGGTGRRAAAGGPASATAGGRVAAGSLGPADGGDDDRVAGAVDGPTGLGVGVAAGTAGAVVVGGVGGATPVGFGGTGRAGWGGVQSSSKMLPAPAATAAENASTSRVDAVTPRPNLPAG